MSYDCMTCGKSIGSLADCYPAEHRKGGSLFYCKTCYNSRVPPGPDEGADEVVDKLLADFAEEKRLGLGLRLGQLFVSLNIIKTYTMSCITGPKMQSWGRGRPRPPTARPRPPRPGPPTTSTDSTSISMSYVPFRPMRGHTRGRSMDASRALITYTSSWTTRSGRGCQKGSWNQRLRQLPGQNDAAKNTLERSSPTKQARGTLWVWATPET